MEELKQQALRFAQRGMLLVNRLQSAQEMALYNRALDMIEQAGIDPDWVSDVRTNGSYLANVQQMKEYVCQIAGVPAPACPVRDGNAVSHPYTTSGSVRNGSAVAQGILPSRRRGRPTKTEAAEWNVAVEAKRQHDERIHPSMFPQPTDSLPTGEGRGEATFDFTMREYKWLLTEALQHDIDTLRDYRTQFAEASRMAKELAEQGSVRNGTAVTQEEIAAYAEEAHQMNAIIEGIYQSADRELAEACLRLKYDPHYVSHMATRGVNTEEVRQALVPKLKAVIALDHHFKQSVLDKIHEEDPALAAERKKRAEAKTEVDAIRKYMLRTDKPATKKRIATMEKRLQRLRELDKAHPELKIEPEAYVAVINKTKQTLSLTLSRKEGEGIDTTEQ